MKTNVLFTAMMLIGLTSANATRTNFVPEGEDSDKTTRYRYAEPIMFMERGVEFLIFPDGSIDFNTNPANSFDNSNDFYKHRQNTSRRSSINSTYHTRENESHGHSRTQRNNGLLVQHDYNGNVSRIGNIYLNYDRVGKIKRVGNIYMNYNRGGILTQVGELRLTYNHWGEIVHSSGIVNHYNSQYNCDLGHGHGNNYNFEASDNDFYYYKQGKHIKKQKKIKK